MIPRYRRRADKTEKRQNALPCKETSPALFFKDIVLLDT